MIPSSTRTTVVRDGVPGHYFRPFLPPSVCRTPDHYLGACEPGSFRSLRAFAPIVIPPQRLFSIRGLPPTVPVFRRPPHPILRSCTTTTVLYRRLRLFLNLSDSTPSRFLSHIAGLYLRFLVRTVRALHRRLCGHVNSSSAETEGSRRPPTPAEIPGNRASRAEVEYPRPTG